MEPRIPPSGEQQVPHFGKVFASLDKGGLVVHVGGGLGELNQRVIGNVP